MFFINLLILLVTNLFKDQNFSKSKKNYNILQNKINFHIFFKLMNLLRAIVTLDTGERPEYIHIYEGDDVELLAEFFCIRHEIMEDGKQFIINEIQK